MARQARIDAPGALHHIIIRGVERKAVFLDDRGREMSAVLHCEGARAQLLSSKQSAEAGTVDCGGIER